MRANRSIAVAVLTLAAALATPALAGEEIVELEYEEYLLELGPRATGAMEGVLHREEFLPTGGAEGLGLIAPIPVEIRFLDTQNMRTLRVLKPDPSIPDMVIRVPTTDIAYDASDMQFVGWCGDTCYEYEIQAIACPGEYPDSSDMVVGVAWWPYEAYLWWMEYSSGGSGFTGMVLADNLQSSPAIFGWDYLVVQGGLSFPQQLQHGRKAIFGWNLMLDGVVHELRVYLDLHYVGCP